jgi:hypothetical protein
LIEPWLGEDHVERYTWILVAKHSIAPIFDSIPKVEQLCSIVEELSGGATSPSEAPFNGLESLDEDSRPTSTLINLLFIDVPATDHCHPPTLKSCSRSLPVLASKPAAVNVSNLKLFDNVVVMPELDPSVSWFETSMKPLPSWLSVCRISPHNDFFGLRSAACFVFSPSGLEDSTDGLLLFYSSHGVNPAVVSQVLNVQPPVEIFALFHGCLQTSLLGQPLKMGLDNAMPIYQAIEPKYWVITHDMTPDRTGLLPYGVSDILQTMQDTVKQVTPRPVDPSPSEEHVPFITVPNGGSLVLV